MRKLLLFLCLSVGIMLTQATDIEIINFDSDLSTWTIENSAGHTVADSRDFERTDTCSFDLDDEQHYQWLINISPNDTSQNNTLLKLTVDGAPIYIVKDNVILGESTLPFYTGTKSPVLKIIGGSNASIINYPWQVFLESGDYMCGGSIISDHYILTAAHCTFDEDNKAIPANVMYVKVGTSTPYEKTGTVYEVKSYTIHENYKSSNYNNDIAILELKEKIDISNAENINLISAEEVANGATNPGVMATVTGWGISETDPVKYPSILQKVELPIISNSTASQVWKNVPSTNLFAGYRSGTKDACSGDSGGPLVVSVDGEMKLAGIVSWGSGECNTYGAYTRVSSYLDWIENTSGVIPDNSLAKPQGNTTICFGTNSSEYYTNTADADTYEWKLLPDSAGQVLTDGRFATVKWAKNYIGGAELKVKADIDGIPQKWKISYITIVENTKIISFSKDTTVCEGDYFVLECEATGDNLSYEWYKDNLFYRTSTEGQYVFLIADTLNSGSYQCIVRGSCGDLVSETADVIVHPRTRIYEQTNDTIATQGEDITLRLESAGHNKHIQWYKDGSAIIGAKGKQLTINATNAVDIGRYYAIVDGTCNTDTSENIYVYVEFEHSDKPKARLWPSVVSDVLNVAISNTDPYKVTIYKPEGYIVKALKNQQQQTVINMSDVEDGYYIVEVSADGLHEFFRCLKKGL